MGKNVETGSGSCGRIANSLNENPLIPVRVIGKSFVSTPEEITKACAEANAQSSCID
jgi:L-arabinose isomerase